MSRAGRRASLGLLAALAACGDPARGEAERAVRAYNDAAIVAYRTREIGPLREVATEKEWGKVVVLVDLKTSNGVVLESELSSLEVTSASRPSPDRLEVATRERWRYFDRPLRPGRSPGPSFVAEMAMQYLLVREGGRWKVERVWTLSNEILEPKGAAAAGGHGHREPLP
ncbi:MAG TPA: hypothetical protein VLS93_12205 [Anaeromyxobacteraceae bacterium]|nr:hypothetical protein [Anaeromyxobacteraceae bacterium]